MVVLLLKALSSLCGCCDHFSLTPSLCLGWSDSSCLAVWPFAFADSISEWLWWRWRKQTLLDTSQLFLVSWKSKMSIGLCSRCLRTRCSRVLPTLVLCLKGLLLSNSASQPTLRGGSDKGRIRVSFNVDGSTRVAGNPLPMSSVWVNCYASLPGCDPGPVWMVITPCWLTWFELTKEGLNIDRIVWPWSLVWKS